MMEHLIGETTLGLRYGCVVLWCGVLLRVTLHWRPAHGQPHADLARIGAWWRATWATLASAIVMASMTHVNGLRGAFLPPMMERTLWLCAAAIFATAGVMALAGFRRYRGEPCGMPGLVAIPLLFVLAALAGFR